MSTKSGAGGKHDRDDAFVRIRSNDSAPLLEEEEFDPDHWDNSAQTLRRLT